MPGWTCSREILALEDQGLGDTVLIWDDPGLVGFAAVHVGAGSEAGSGCGFIKFGAARPGPKAGEYFDRLLTACEAYAAAQGAQRSSPGSAWPASPPMSRCGPGALSPRSWACVCINPTNPATTGRRRVSLMIGGSLMGRQSAPDINLTGLGDGVWGSFYEEGRGRFIEKRPLVPFPKKPINHD